MKSFLIILLTLISIPILTIAQGNDKKGLVVTAKGDTLKGLIDYQEWITNPRSISFKSDAAPKDIRAYSPAEITYFVIENLAAYQTFIGKASADKTDPKSLSRGIDTSKVAIQSFLKILQKGPRVTLYMLSDEVKLRYFIKEEGTNNIQELIYHYYIEPNSNRLLQTANIYMGQLWNLATKYNVATPALQYKNEHSAFISSDLIKIVSALNGFGKTYSEFIATKENFRFLAGAGINYATTFVAGTHPLAGPAAVSKSSVLPKLVIGVDKFINPNVRRIFLRGEISFTKTDQKITVRTENTYANEAFTQTIISLSPQVIYNAYNKENLKLFIGTGLSGNIASYKMLSFYELEKFYFSIPIRAGITFHKFEISALYFPPTPISKYTDIEFKTKSVHVQVNYLFNK